MAAIRMNIPARWPSGPVPWMIVLAYVSMLMVAFWPGGRQLPLLDNLWNLAIKLHRTEDNVKLLMTAAMGVHTVEALFTAWLCWRAGLPHEQMMGWCSLTLLLGYGAIRPLRQLISAAASTAAAAAAGKGS